MQHNFSSIFTSQFQLQIGLDAGHAWLLFHAHSDTDIDTPLALLSGAAQILK